MKTDLATSICTAVVGILIAYFVCNLFLGDPAEFSVKKLDSTVSADLVDPNVNVFNYKAINPTVEVYVGDCKEYNKFGECIDESASAIEEGTIGDEAEDLDETSTKEENNTSDQGNP